MIYFKVQYAAVFNTNMTISQLKSLFPDKSHKVFLPKTWWWRSPTDEILRYDPLLKYVVFSVLIISFNSAERKALLQRYLHSIIATYPLTACNYFINWLKPENNVRLLLQYWLY